MSGYNASNSLSPMMFKKTKDQHSGGTRNERLRSKSVEHIYDSNALPPTIQSNNKKSKWPFGRSRACTTEQLPSGDRVTSCTQKPAVHQWKEVDKIKALAPVVACILPSLAMDFVASSLLAVGAVPLIPEGKHGV